MTILLTAAETAARLRISRRTLFNMLAKDAFVRPVYLGKRTMRFSESEVEAWLRDRLAERTRTSS